MALLYAGMLRVLFIGLLATVAGAACDRPALAPGEAARLAEPYLEHFSRLDRWARRSLTADPAWLGRGLLEEALFAPVRRDDDVLELWVERDGGGSRALSFRGRDPVPSDLAWVQLREGFEGVRIAVGRCPDRRRGSRSESVSCLFLSRRQPGEHGAVVTVTVAYPREIERRGLNRFAESMLAAE